MASLVNLKSKLLKPLANASPSSLCGAAIGTAWLGAILMIPATIKAIKRKEERKPEGVLETIKCVAPCYIPPVSALVVSTVCANASNEGHLRQNASTVALVTAAKHSLKEYQDIVKDVVSVDDQEKIASEQAKRRIAQNPPPTDDRLPAVGQEITEFGAPRGLCMEAYTKKYFMFAPADLKNIAAEINKELATEGFYAFTDLMWHFGLDPINDTELGWFGDDFFRNGECEFEFRTRTEYAPDGRSVLVIDYWIQPHHA